MSRHTHRCRLLIITHHENGSDQNGQRDDIRRDNSGCRDPGGVGGSVGVGIRYRGYVSSSDWSVGSLGSSSGAPADVKRRLWRARDELGPRTTEIPLDEGERQRYLWSEAA